MFPAKLVVTTPVYECRTSYLAHASVLLFQTLIQPAWQPTQVNTRLSVAECTCVDEQSSSKGKKKAAKSNGHSSSFKWTCNTCTKPCSKQCQIDGSQCQKVNDLSIMAVSGNVCNTINGSRHQIQNHCKQDKNPVQQAFFSFQRALVERTYSRNQCTQIEIPNTTNGIRVMIQQCTQVYSRAQNTNRQEVVTEPANLLQQPAAEEMILVLTFISRALERFPDLPSAYQVFIQPVRQ